MSSEQPPKPPAESPSSGNGLWAIGWKVLGLSAEQQRGLVALVLTGFLMWFVWDAVNQGRRAESERTALMVRAFESEGEKSRQAVSDVGKLTVASHQKLTMELGKLESRLGDMNTQMNDLKTQIQYLGTMVAELKKKLPPMEVFDFAPMPRLKDVAPVGPRPVIG